MIKRFGRLTNCFLRQSATWRKRVVERENNTKRNVQICSEEKYLPENIVDHVEIHVRFRQAVKQTGKTKTYNTDELRELNQYCDCKYAETEDSAFLAKK